MLHRTYSANAAPPSPSGRVVLALRKQSGQDTQQLAERLAMPVGVTQQALVDLAERGIVGTRMVGRVPRHAYRGDEGVVAAIDVAGTEHRVVVADLCGRVLRHSRHPIASPQLHGAELAGLLEVELDRTGHGRTDLWHVVLGLPAALGGDGRVRHCPLFPQLVGVDLASRLAADLSCPVEVRDAVSLASIAEASLGVGNLSNDFLHVWVGPRVSGRLVVDGLPREGAHGNAGLVLQRMAGGEDPFGDLGWGGHECQATSEAALAGDQSALARVREALVGLARGIAAAVLTVDPENVVVSGVQSARITPWLAELQAALRAELSPVPVPTLLVSSLGTDASVAGGTVLALEVATRDFVGELLPAPMPSAWHPEWHDTVGRPGGDPHGQGIASLPGWVARRGGVA